MDWGSILFFIAWIALTGYSVLYFLKKREDLTDQILLSIALGLAAIPLLGTVLSILRIPLHWSVFLLIAAAVPVYALIKHREELRFEKKWFTPKKIHLIWLGLLVIFAFSMVTYVGGALNHSYLENFDPYRHAVSASYVAQEMTLQTTEHYTFKYLNPYPPGYAIVMGVLHQTNDSVNWTLKFFNGLILSLGILFSFVAFRKILPNDYYALFSTAVLAMIPSFFTRFIWAQGLAVIMLFPLIYALYAAQKNKNWYYAVALIISAICLTQPTKAMKIIPMIGLYWVIKALYERSWNWEVIASTAGGVGLSLTWWYDKWQGMLSAGVQNVAGSQAQAVNQLPLLQRLLEALPASSGSATRAYTFADFFIAQKNGMINVHVGWGIFASILIALGLLYFIIHYKQFLTAKKGLWPTTIITWFIFAFLGVNAMTFNLPIGLMTFRFWLILAVPAAILAGYGLVLLVEANKKLLKEKIPVAIIVIVLVLGVFATSGYQKYFQNTQTNWPPGEDWSSQEQFWGFLQMKNTFSQEPVYALCGKDELVIGLDQHSYPWREGVTAFRDRVPEVSAQDIAIFTQEHGYKYILIDSACLQAHGINETARIAENLNNDPRFAPAINRQGFIVFGTQ